MSIAWKVREKAGWFFLEGAVHYVADQYGPFIQAGAFETADQAWRFARSGTAAAIVVDANAARVA
ncbi:MAG: hypothetical protein OXS35_05555 [Dehalococcoidia bacterium]|nr:hypothetical protein [Dehalococcoidia bacterium]